jgi:hypothetical protein
VLVLDGVLDLAATTLMNLEKQVCPLCVLIVS